MEQRIGKRRVIRTLGQGGMGRVLLAEATGAGGFVRLVVLKQVRDCEDADLRSALLDEARVQATLVHRNIVPVLDLEEHEGQHFVVLEYVDGMDLRGVVEASTKLSWQLVLYVGMEIAAALDYAHRRKDPSGAPLGLVHRDVTPPNILCSWEGEVKLTDFGVAQTGGAREGAVVGNFPYISPEQASAQPVDARADIYSLGVVLYEALTGTNPFRHKKDAVTLAAVRVGAFPPIPEALAPAQLRALITSMMATDRDARPPDAARLREAFVAIEGRLPDPVHTFAKLLLELRARTTLDGFSFQRLLAVGRALTRRLGSQVKVADARDTVAEAHPAGLGFPRWPLRAAIALLVLAVVVMSVKHALHHEVVPPTGDPVAGDPVPHPTPHVVGPTPAIVPVEPPADAAAPQVVAEPPVKPPASRPAHTRKKPGFLSVNAIPWAEVWLDDSTFGHTPRLQVSVPAGHHRLRLRSHKGDERVRNIEIRPGQQSKVTVLFGDP